MYMHLAFPSLVPSFLSHFPTFIHLWTSQISHITRPVYLTPFAVNGVAAAVGIPLDLAAEGYCYRQYMMILRP